MRMKLMFGVVLALLMSMSGIAAHAQDMSRFNVTTGYNFLFSHFSSDTAKGKHGYFLSGVYNFNDNVGFEMEFTGNHGTKLDFEDSDPDDDFLNRQVEMSDTYTVLFGPNFRTAVPSMSNFSLYGHALAGVSRVHVAFAQACCDVGDPFETEFAARGTGFAAKVGGGLNYNRGRWGIRIAGLDYIHGGGQFTEFECFGLNTTCKEHETFSGVEVSTGITINFGMR